MAKQADRKRSVLKRCGMVALVVCLLLLCALVGFRTYWARRVQAELAAVRAAGYPTTPQELAAWRPAPEGENAAGVYVKAFDLYRDPDVSLSRNLPVENVVDLPALGEPLPAAVTTAIASYVADNAEALKLLHQAAVMKSCRFSLVPNAWPGLGNLARMRGGARRLAVETFMHAQDGNGERAASAVCATLAAGRHLCQEPRLIAHLVRLATDAIALGALERTLSMIPLSEKQLDRLDAALQESSGPEALPRALSAELCAIADGPGLAAETALQKTVLVFGRVTGLHHMGRAAALKLMREAVARSEAAPAERVRAVRSVKPGYESTRLCWRTSQAVVHLDTVRLSVEKDACDIARLRAARTALAVERHRRTRGLLPEKLADLVPEFIDAIPIDPFNGEPLRYKKLAEGYVVYSVGVDGEDDGGSGDREAESGRRRDITFTVAR